MFQSVRPLNTLRRAVLAGLALAALSACSADHLAGPTLSDAATPPAMAIVGSGLSTISSATISATALLRTTPLATPITRKLFVTRTKGGMIDIPAAGFNLIVPAGAIGGDTLTITVTALAGSAVAYEFQPHGAKFLKALRFSQKNAGTSYEILKTSNQVLRGGYFKSTAQINPLTGAAVIDERLPVYLNSTWIAMDLWHFSGYMVSTD